MPADISGLELKPLERLEGDIQAPGVPQPPPIPGTYVGSAPDTFEYSATKNGDLMVTLGAVKIVAPTNAGFELKFQRASSKTYKNRNSSPAIDYLRACGITTIPGSNDELVALVESTAGKPFQFDLDWEAYDKDDQTSIEGYENFPDDGKDGKAFYVKNPNTGNNLRARARIRRFRTAGA